MRLMQASSPTEVGATLSRILDHEIAGTATTEALDYLDGLFGRRGRPGIVMAARALRGAMPEDRITALCTAYCAELLRAARK